MVYYGLRHDLFKKSFPNHEEARGGKKCTKFFFFKKKKKHISQWTVREKPSRFHLESPCIHYMYKNKWYSVIKLTSLTNVDSVISNNTQFSWEL